MSKTGFFKCLAQAPVRFSGCDGEPATGIAQIFQQCFRTGVGFEAIGPAEIKVLIGFSQCLRLFERKFGVERLTCFHQPESDDALDGFGG